MYILLPTLPDAVIVLVEPAFGCNINEEPTRTLPNVKPVATSLVTVARFMNTNSFALAS